MIWFHDGSFNSQLAYTCQIANKLLSVFDHFERLVLKGLTFIIQWKNDTQQSPIDTGRKLNVNKTFRRHPRRLMHVQFTSCVYGGGNNKIYTERCRVLYVFSFHLMKALPGINQTKKKSLVKAKHLHDWNIFFRETLARNITPKPRWKL